MRYFEVLGIQHFFMYLFPAIATIVLFIIGLGFYHIQRKDSAERVECRLAGDVGSIPRYVHLDADRRYVEDVAAFSILVLVLIFRPTGLLGKPEVEKV